MFAELFHSTIKGIHLALEVKTTFGNSMPMTGSSSQKPRVPTDTHRQHHRKREEETCTQKVRKQSLSNYGQQDLPVVTKRSDF
jgi:hypothetical protein